MLKRKVGGPEAGLSLLNDFVKEDSSYIPGLLCVCVGKFLMKKTSEAMNLLKMIVKMNY